jgi:hypothetical protein
MLKKIVLPITILFLNIALLAQAPGAFKFQGVARDANGQVYRTTAIQLRLALLEEDSSLNPLAIYEEQHTIFTSPQGVFSVNIGEGTPLIGSFTLADWQNNQYSLQVQFNADGSNNFIDLGKSKLLSVPYALHAESVTNSDDADADPQNEIQRLSIVGDSLVLSNNGGAILLAATGQGPAGPQGETGPAGPQGPAGTYTAGAGITISNDQISATDADPTNEIQQLTIDDGQLKLSQTPGGISLDLLSSTPWEVDANILGGGVNGIFYGRKVGIGTIPSTTSRFAIEAGNDQGMTINTSTDLQAAVISQKGNGVGLNVRSETGVAGIFDKNSGGPSLVTLSGGAGLDNLPTQATAVVKGAFRTNLTLDGTESGGASSLSFRQANNDVFSEYIWRSDFGDQGGDRLSLTHFSGDGSGVVNLDLLYSVQRKQIFATNFYEHIFNGNASFDNYLKVESGQFNFGILEVESSRDAATNLSKNFRWTGSEGTSDTSKLSFDAVNFFDNDGQLVILNPEPIAQYSYHEPTRSVRSKFFGLTEIDRLELKNQLNISSNNSQSINLNKKTGSLTQTLNINSSYSADNALFSTAALNFGYEQADVNSGAFSDLGYQMLYSPDLGLFKHIFQGATYTDRLVVQPNVSQQFNNPLQITSGGRVEIYPEDGEDGLYILTPENNGVGLVVSSQNENKPAILSFGHIGINTINPKSELTIGGNFNTSWGTPSASIGGENTTGGGLEIGTINESIRFFSNNFDNAIEVVEGNTVGEGHLNIRASQVNVGSNAVARTKDYPMSVIANRDEVTCFSLRSASGLNNWQLYPNNGSQNLVLYFNNDAIGFFNGSTGTYSTGISDRNRKENITDVEEFVTSFERLQIHEYNYLNNPDQTYTGFVAQELKEIFPTAVTELSIEEDEESVLIVDYDQVTAINSGAIKEQ